MIVLDVGCGIAKRKLEGKALKLATEGTYIGLEMRVEKGVMVLGDGGYLPIRDGSIDVVLSRAVLEHTKEPGKMIDEIFRVLKPGGLCWVVAPFLTPYHGCERYEDYWRYTETGLIEMFKDFKLIWIKGKRSTLSKITNTVLHFKQPWNVIRAYEALFEKT